MRRPRNSRGRSRGIPSFAHSGVAIGEKSVWVYQIVSTTAVVIVFVGHVMIHEDGVGGSGGSVVVVVVIVILVVVVVVVFDFARRVRCNGGQ